MTWREVVPLPSRFWIRHLPRRWPDADETRLDLYEHKIVWASSAGARAAASERLPAPAGVADVALVPPVRKGLVASRTGLVIDLLAARVPVLDQCCSADAEVAASGATPVADLLDALLEENFAAIDEVPERAWIVVPLLPVLSDRPERWAPILSRVATRRPRAVVGLAPELEPLDRRRLVDRMGEAHFEAIHHSAADEGGRIRLERAFAGAVARAGLAPFVDRPAIELPPRLARNRALATLLAECGELWLRLGRSESEGAGLLAAARHFESPAVAGLDIAALSREGNLAHLGFLSPLALTVVDRAAQPAEGAAPALRESLRAEYLA